jgi:Fur family transcriptional regulator, ferric uptake regulator
MAVLSPTYNLPVALDTNALIARLSAGSHRITLPRKAVIDVICASDNSLDCSELLKRARKLHKQVGLATVYRTLDMLEAIGSVRRVTIDGRAHVVACADQSLHFHLVCGKCHGVTELHSPQQDSLRTLARSTGFEPVDQPVEIVGLCKACR